MTQLFLAFIIMNFCSAPTATIRGSTSMAASSRKEVAVCFAQMKECINQKHIVWQESIAFCMDQTVKGDK